MKATVKINYRTCDLQEKFLVFRIIQEIYAEKGTEILSSTSSQMNQNIILEAFYNDYSYCFLRFCLRKLKELKVLAPKVSLQISHDLGNNKSYSIDYIQKKVCSYFNVPVEMMQSNTRKREVAQTRQIVMFFSKSLTKLSLAKIGLELGGKDHATCLYAIKTVNNLCETDKIFKAQITEIENQLKK